MTWVIFRGWVGFPSSPETRVKQTTPGPPVVCRAPSSATLGRAGVSANTFAPSGSTILPSGTPAAVMVLPGATTQTLRTVVVVRRVVVVVVLSFFTRPFESVIVEVVVVVFTISVGGDCEIMQEERTPCTRNRIDKKTSSYIDLLILSG